MSLKVSTAISIQAMDDSTIINLVKVDTAINPNPFDQKSDPPLAKITLQNQMEALGAEAQSRLDDYGSALNRVIDTAAGMGGDQT